MSMDLSYLEALLGGGAAEGGGASGGVWVVSPEGGLGDGILRLVGKARVVADALGGYVYLLLAGAPDRDGAPRAIAAGADRVLAAAGAPAVPDLADFLAARSPQAILLPHTYLGRVYGAGLAQILGAGLVGLAADLAVDPVSQRLIAHQPLLNDEARQAVTILTSTAVAVVDTGALPAAFSEPWRSGEVEEVQVSWPAPAAFEAAELPAAPVTLATAPVVVAAGRAVREEGFALAKRLAGKLGGVVAGDVGALDAGWIDENQLVDLTGQSVAPRLYLALGISGDSGQFMSIQNAGAIVAVQDDPSAPIVRVADWNIIADPVEFATALLTKLEG